jgi:hypothetical protein
VRYAALSAERLVAAIPTPASGSLPDMTRSRFVSHLRHRGALSDGYRVPGRPGDGLLRRVMRPRRGIGRVAILAKAAGMLYPERDESPIWDSEGSMERVTF